MTTKKRNFLIKKQLRKAEKKLGLRVGELIKKVKFAKPVSLIEKRA